MRADEVPDELVELAEPVLREMLATEGVFVPLGHPRLDHVGRRILAAVLPLAYAEAMEHAAKRISPYSGIGLANGATRGDVAVWLLEYAAAMRAAETERTS